MYLDIEKITGDYIVLASTEQFNTLKTAFENCESYEERLKFFTALPIFVQKFKEGSLLLRITSQEVYQHGVPVIDEQQISIAPGKEQPLSCIHWLIALPDDSALSWIQQYDEFEEKDILAEVRLSEFTALMEKDSYFRQLYVGLVEEGIKLLLFRYIAAASEYRPDLSQFVFTLRKALAWNTFLTHIGLTDAHKLSENAKEQGMKYKAREAVKWKGDSSTLVLLIKLLWEKGYLEASSLKEAFTQTGQFFGKDLKYAYDSIAKMYDRNNKDYQNKLIHDLLEADKELKESYAFKNKKKR